jgi:DNA invertase Pin-like site-specific DNA recombinase
MGRKKGRKFYRCAIGQYQLEKQTTAAQKIEQAIEKLKLENALPDGATARAQAIALHGNLSQQTLYKSYNKPLWHPQYEGQSSKTATTCLSIKT